jgi:hypothetical protein
MQGHWPCRVSLFLIVTQPLYLFRELDCREDSKGIMDVGFEDSHFGELGEIYVK